MPRWACEGCGQLTRRAFECQDGFVKGCGHLTRRAFECQDGLVRNAGSLPAELSSVKMGL